MSDDANEPPSEYQLIGPADDGKISDLLAGKTAKDGNGKYKRDPCGHVKRDPRRREPSRESKPSAYRDDPAAGSFSASIGALLLP